MNFLSFISSKAWKELAKLGVVFLLMIVGIIYLKSDFDQYKIETNLRITTLENELHDCNEGRIQDLKMFHASSKKHPIKPAHYSPILIALKPDDKKYIFSKYNSPID